MVLVHIQSMNAKRRVKDVVTPSNYQDSLAVMALAYHNMIINTACMVYKGVIDVEENESREKLKVHAARLMRFVG